MAHKLLLADDSVTIQKVIELTFADEDITVIAVGDGRQAIQQAVAERPDIVLADVGMPERDGYEVAAFIKNSPDLAHIPVLLLTGAFEPIDEGRARAARCDGVLVKPFEPQMVINRVKDLIAGRPPAQAASAGSSPPAVAGHPVQPQASVEEYFDQLDAAFAAKDGHRVPPQGPRPDDAPSLAGLAEELANWTPDLTPPVPSDSAPAPSREVSAAPSLPAFPSEAPPPPSVPAGPGEARPVPWASGPVPARETAPAPASPALPSLAEAFAALLAAERGQPHTPSSINQVALKDDVVEQVTRRVLERIGDGVVRDVVLDIAERLVREEIARIKSKAP